MTLPPAAPRRQLKHRRQIDVTVRSRGDGPGEVDASRHLRIDRRLAQKSDGEVLRQFYPRWHRPAAVVPPTD